MNATVEPHHLIAAHGVVEELQQNPRVTLEQVDGKDVIAQALANAGRGYGFLRELARMVQRVVSTDSTDPDQRALLLMASDVLEGRMPGQVDFDKLLAASSLGTPEVMAARKQADPQQVKEVLRRADQLSKPGSKFGETVTIVFQMTEKGTHVRVDGYGAEYYLFEPRSRWAALTRIGERLGWRLTSTVMSDQRPTDEQESINEVLHYADMLSSDLSGDAKRREGILYQLQQATRLLNSRRLVKEHQPRPSRAMELIESCRRELGALRDADDGTDSTTRQVLSHAVSAISTLVAAVEALQKP